MENNEQDQPTDGAPDLQNGHQSIKRHAIVDRHAQKFVEKTGAWQEKARAKKPAAQTPEGGAQPEKKGPAGGFDATPVPHAPPGWTVKFTFHRATNLPMADIGTFSSDPYIHATLKTDLGKRHKQDPDPQFRTLTIRRNCNPVWNTEWIVANVPSSGFALKCRLYDEDPADHDDRLGNIHVHVNNITQDWPGIREQPYKIKKRMGSKRAYLVRGCASLFNRNLEMSGEVIVSVECLGRTPGDEGGRCYTIGPCHWTRHFSPMIGRLAGTKDTSEDKPGDKTEHYNFQAIQIQLEGPVPAPLYHRYVEFKPFVAGMFTSHSLRGRILNHTLHHQHARIYNFDRSTVYGLFPKPCVDMTKQFLDFVHYDQGGRIFTYVLTLDAHWRFTETGKEFGIDMLSKHTMHSDVAIYIAFSGEFFIRRLKHPHHQHSPDPGTAALPPAPEPDEEEHAKEPSKDPAMYELVIDNDSGTYRPNAKYLPQLKKFMAENLPGLKVSTLDCQADEEKMKKLKNEQRQRKKESGKQVTYAQTNASGASISSSDEEELDQRAGVGKGSSKLHKAADKAKQPKAAALGIISGGAVGGTGQDEQKEEVLQGPPETGQEEKKEEGAAETEKGGHSGNGEAVEPREEDAPADKHTVPEASTAGVSQAEQHS